MDGPWSRLLTATGNPGNLTNLEIVLLLVGGLSFWYGMTSVQDQWWIFADSRHWVLREVVRRLTFGLACAALWCIVGALMAFTAGPFWNHT